MNDFVFTYWEGETHPFTELCISSINRIFGVRHKHLTDRTIGSWISLPHPASTCLHIPFRSDYIRTLLLQNHGGWWFDCDVLLFRDPSELVQPTTPKIWNLIYWWKNEWVPLINNGILYSPQGSTWINEIAKSFQEVDTTSLTLNHSNEDIGQNIYELHSLKSSHVEIGNEYDFNSRINVDADYEPFWDGTIRLDSANYGIHLGASLSRWAAGDGDEQASRTIGNATLEEVISLFPESVVAQYYRDYVL